MRGPRAMLADRLEVPAGRPQICGTQLSLQVDSVMAAP